MPRIVVVGGGIAGLSAALTAQESGADVVLLERAPREQRGGNTRFSNSAIRTVSPSRDKMLSLVPDLTPEERDRCDFRTYAAAEYLSDFLRVTGSRCDRDLASTVIHHSYATLVWLSEHGVRFGINWDWAVTLPDGRLRVGLEARGSGAGLSDSLFAFVEQRGIDIRYATRAEALHQDDDGIVGVQARVGPRRTLFPADAVVLAAGGFQASPEWRARYLGPGWDLVKVRGSRYDTGDGLRMALQAGAAAYGNWSGCHAASWDRDAPDMNELRFNTQFKRDDFNLGIMVNNNGDRFADEGEDSWGYIYAKMGARIRTQPGQVAWQVYDAKVQPLLHADYRLPNTCRVVADSLEDLAARMVGMDQAGFLSTVAAFNRAVGSGVPFDPRRKDGRRTHGLAIDKSNWAQALDAPPFEAFGVTCGITFTFGGVHIDSSGRVLDVDDQPIPRLYAAGDMVGGLFYGNYPGGSGLASAAVFGRLAGSAAATDGRQRQLPLQHAERRHS
jgi:tricarballylate dehydrogenase